MDGFLLDLGLKLSTTIVVMILSTHVLNLNSLNQADNFQTIQDWWSTNTIVIAGILLFSVTLTCPQSTPCRLFPLHSFNEITEKGKIIGCVIT